MASVNVKKVSKVEQLAQAVSKLTEAQRKLYVKDEEVEGILSDVISDLLILIHE